MSKWKGASVTIMVEKIGDFLRLVVTQHLKWDFIITSLY